MYKILLAFFLCFSFSSHGQSIRLKENTLIKNVTSDVYHVSRSILHVYQRPFSWKKKDWLIFGGVIGTAVSVSFLDEEINAYFKRNKTHLQNELASVGDFLGQPEYQGPVLLAFYSLGASINNQWIRETGSMLAASMAASGLIQTFSKDAVGRARPSKGEGSLLFSPFGGKNYHSFPSGHTMLALSSSYILARQVKPLALKIPLYSISAIVGWSRVYDNAHWTSDIILGSALGIATAEAVIQYYSRVKKEGQLARLHFLPSTTGGILVYKL